MEAHQREFIEFALDCGVLRFGEFELKSGRKSPYFFNAGLFNTGTRLARLGRYYAAALAAVEADYDMLFGPAYKGIVLAAATAIGVAERSGRDVPYAFDRKEAKDHGEGGLIVGAPLNGRVIVVDDVMSSGRSVREAANIIAGQGAVLAGVCIALDRQERGAGELTAVREVVEEHGVPVFSVIKLEHIRDFLEQQPAMEAELNAIAIYLSQYGVEV